MQTLQERTGIKKKVYPHLFRHSRASHLANQFTEQQLKQFLGWTAGSNMASVYVHLSQRDIQNPVLKAYGIESHGEDKDTFKVGRYPRCKELNPETSLYCGKCGLPLKEDVKNKINRDMQEIDLGFMKAVAANPKVLEALAEELNKIQTNKTV